MFITPVRRDTKSLVFDVFRRFGKFHLSINMNIRARECIACPSWTDNVELYFGKLIRRRCEEAFIKKHGSHRNRVQAGSIWRWFFLIPNPDVDAMRNEIKRNLRRKISGKRLGWEPGPIQVPGYALKFRLQKRRPANRGEIVGRIVDDAARGLICRTKSMKQRPVLTRRSQSPPRASSFLPA